MTQESLSAILRVKPDQLGNAPKQKGNNKMTITEIIRSSFNNNIRESETILGHLTGAIENATQPEYVTKDNLDAIREMNYHLMKALTFAENI